MFSTILLVSSHRPDAQLIRKVTRSGFQVSQAWSLAEYREALTRPERFDLVITDEKLSDGTWSRVLDLALDSGMNCEVIVTTHTGDASLWAEVLSRGGFDILVAPFHGTEVNRIIRGAIGSNYLRRFALPRLSRSLNLSERISRKAISR